MLDRFLDRIAVLTRWYLGLAIGAAKVSAYFVLSRWTR